MQYVTYFRQSTLKQQTSGLGVEAQKAAVSVFLKVEDAVVGSFTETELGKLNARPQLQAALRLCRQRKATLLIAKLDRLSRNVAFLATLLEGDVPMIACDNPNATRFTLHILAAVAEHEGAMISQRTRAALLAAKARGVCLGRLRYDEQRDVRRGATTLLYVCEPSGGPGQRYGKSVAGWLHRWCPGWLQLAEWWVGLRCRDRFWGVQLERPESRKFDLFDRRDTLYDDYID